MTSIIEAQIEQSEQRLKQAMQQSDIVKLDELLATELVFTNHLGQTSTKQDDIQAHQTGVLNITTLSLSNQMIRVYDNFAIVTVQANIVGVFNGIESESQLRFTRVWQKQENNSWQVLVAHSSIIA